MSYNNLGNMNLSRLSRAEVLSNAESREQEEGKQNITIGISKAVIGCLLISIAIIVLHQYTNSGVNMTAKF